MSEGISFRILPHTFRIWSLWSILIASHGFWSTVALKEEKELNFFVMLATNDQSMGFSLNLAGGTLWLRYFLSSAHQKSPNALLIFYFPQGRPLTHKHQPDGKTKSSGVFGGEHQKVVISVVHSVKKSITVQRKSPSRLSIGKDWSNYAQRPDIVMQSSLDTRNVQTRSVAKCERNTGRRWINSW